MLLHGIIVCRKSFVRSIGNRILCEVTEENAAGAEKNCLQFRPLNRILLVLPAQREPDNNQ